LGNGISHKEGMELDEPMEEQQELVEKPYEYNDDEDQAPNSRPNEEQFDLE
jgi:hypothetical protein